MNTQLEKLFDIHHFSAKDRYDFSQIYSLLPAEKKVRVIDHFSEVAQEMKQLREQLYIEQNILFGETIEHIESRLQRTQKEKILSGSRGHIELLRKSF